MMDYKDFLSDTLLDSYNGTVTFSRLDSDEIAKVINNKDDIMITLNAGFQKDETWLKNIEKAIDELCPGIVQKASELDMDIVYIVLLYLCFSADYGHLNPKKGGVIRLSDWSGYAGKMTWQGVGKEIEDQLN